MYRSNKHIYAQIIDDVKGETLHFIQDKDIAVNHIKVDLSTKVGQAIAKKQAIKVLKKSYSIRGGYLYHGRVKLLSKLLSGLEF